MQAGCMFRALLVEIQPVPREKPFPLLMQISCNVLARFLVRVTAITFPSDAECCPYFSLLLR